MNIPLSSMASWKRHCCVYCGFGVFTALTELLEDADPDQCRQSPSEFHEFELDEEFSLKDFADVLRGGLFHCSTGLNGLFTMSFSSTIQILKINEVEKGIAKKTGQPWERHTAECMLLNDDGTIDCVGRLVIPTAMRETLQVGTFRAGFSLVVPTFGDQKGDISARLTSLLPVVSSKPVAPASPAKAAA